MGITLSTPNFNLREDQLLLPNEILYKITDNLGPRDIFWAQLVCRSWFSFATTWTNHPHWFVGDGFGVRCVGSEERLHQLAMAHQRQNFALDEQENGIRGAKTVQDDPLPLRIAAFFLENVELTRQPLSHQFWTLYSETITRLEFTDCAVLPRVRVETRGADGNLVNFDTNFNLGCPNLKKLALRKMDKSFMMGGEYLEFHHILCLSNLVSLDVSSNKNITDRILFDLLLKTEKLESLNLMACPLVLSRAVHNRFYPRANPESGDDPGHVFQFSDHIFSFETIVRQFLSQPRGAHMRELILKATPLNSYSLELIRDPSIFTWESLDLSYCRELKKDALISVLSAHSKTLKQLSIKSDGRGVGVVIMDVLKQVRLPKLECLSLRHASFDREAVSVFGSMPKLKKLSCSSSGRAPVLVRELHLNGSLMEAEEKVFSGMKNVTHLSLANSNEFVNNALVQVVIQTMKCLKKLNLTGCESISDFGLTGLASPAQERNWEQSDLDPSLNSATYPTWLLRPGSGPKRSAELEAELHDLIENGDFPRKLDSSLISNRRDWTGCLSDLKYLEDLDLSSCRNLSELTWHFAICFPSLHSLNLTRTSLSLNSIGVICKNCPCVEYLTLVETHPLVNITPMSGFVKTTLNRLREFRI